MIAVVGSQAAIQNGLNLRRKPTDLDIVCSSQEFEELITSYGESVERLIDTEEGRAAFVKLADGRLIIDAEFTDGPHLSAKLLHERIMTSDKVMTIQPGIEAKVADTHTLYELKMSHRFKKDKNIGRGIDRFHKTMRDIHVLREAGATILDETFFKAREYETYNYSHPSLAQSKEDFFKDDGIKYVYDHDTIHQSVAHFDKPAYLFYKLPDHPVMCSSKMFFNADRMVRLYGVLEEAYVLALERAVIPHNTDRDVAFQIALYKVCTSITSGWFREYAWENYLTVRRMYNPDYVDRFEKALADGLVLPFTGEKY